MGATGYVNGEYFASPEEAKVSLFDRGYLLGDSIFATLRTYGGSVFRLDDHLRTFAHGADVLGMTPPRVEDVRTIVRECVARSGLAEAYLRITMSRGEGPPGLGIAGYDHPVLSVIVRPLHRYPAVAYAEGIASTIVRTRKVPAACLDPSLKTGNYLSAIQARRELARSGMIEGIQLAIEGHVVSGTISNVFAISGNVLRTPDVESGCRPGITRAVVLELASSVGLIAREETLDVEDLLHADEVFFTNTVMECLSVASIDGVVLPKAPGRQGLAIRAAFEALVERETQ